MHFNGVCFRLHDGTIAKEQVVEFLKALLTHWRQPLLILWDSLQAIAATWCAITSPRPKAASTHFLPGYAPDLNPVEFLWACQAPRAQPQPPSRHTARATNHSAAAHTRGAQANGEEIIRLRMTAMSKGSRNFLDW